MMPFLTFLGNNRIIIISLLVLGIGGFIYNKYDNMNDEIKTLSATIKDKNDKIENMKKELTIKELTINTHIHSIEELNIKIDTQNKSIDMFKVDQEELVKKIDELKNIKPSIKYIKESNGNCEKIKDNLKTIKGLKYEDL